jgi:hypothetical protein
MNKLLSSLADDSREEVRNQSLVFIKQLTSVNEEMKKTVVFNEVNQFYLFLVYIHTCFL